MITFAYESRPDYVYIESDKRPGLSNGFSLSPGFRFKQFTSQYVIIESDTSILQYNEDGICQRQIWK